LGQFLGDSAPICIRQILIQQRLQAHHRNLRYALVHRSARVGDIGGNVSLREVRDETNDSYSTYLFHFLSNSGCRYLPV
jgi:hypothetical protein